MTYSNINPAFKEDLASQRMASSPEPGASLNRERTPDLEAQLQFLSLDGQNSIGLNGSSSRSIDHAVLVSPTLEEMGEKMPAQFGLLGHLATKQSEDLVDPRVMLNTNIPFSAFVCGLQGSGKSHTTSCMIGKTSNRSPHNASGLITCIRKLFFALSSSRNIEEAVVYLGIALQRIQLQCQ